ncbi:hypothetical protein CRUP_001492 [Coryphaenoides rupestris]|nr:hypothetical protein CRUP_001492 [Coryphaenoides rupestris]
MEVEDEVVEEEVVVEDEVVVVEEVEVVEVVVVEDEVVVVEEVEGWWRWWVVVEVEVEVVVVEVEVVCVWWCVEWCGGGEAPVGSMETTRCSRKALEESKKELESKGGTAFMDLVDVFAVPPDVSHHSTNPWGDVAPQGAAATAAAPATAAGLTVARDPWDSLDDTHRVAEAPWRPPALGSGKPEPVPCGPLGPEPVPRAPLGPEPVPAGPLGQPQERRQHRRPSVDLPPLTQRLRVPGGPSEDGDLFDEAMDGGQFNLNGRGEGSPSCSTCPALDESLAAPSPRNCRTPEAFLDPSAASLVNLDAPDPRQPRGQNHEPLPIRSCLQRLVAPAASQQQSSLPTSLTHPARRGGPDLTGGLPQPLLPLSSASTLVSQSEQHSQNPFL